MELSIKETAALLRISERGVRARIQRGSLKAFKRGGRWRVPKATLPISPEIREYVQNKANEIRGAVEASLSEALPKGHSGLQNLKTFQIGAQLLKEIQTPEAKDLLQTALMDLAEGHHEYEREAKRRALSQARVNISRCVALLLLAEELEAAQRLEAEALPPLAGLIRWAEKLKEAPKR